MKKTLLIGGSAFVLILAVAFGAFIAGPLVASANSNTAATIPLPAESGTPTTTNSSSNCSQYQQDLARRLNISVSKLQQEEQSARNEVLYNMVRAGLITQSQAQNYQKQQLTTICSEIINQVTNYANTQFVNKYRTQIEDKIASSLNMTPAQLNQQLKSGKSLDQIAAEHNISRSQLQMKVNNAIHSTLITAVNDRYLTQLEANAIWQYVQSHQSYVNSFLSAQLPNSTTSSSK